MKVKVFCLETGAKKTDSTYISVLVEKRIKQQRRNRHQGKQAATKSGNTRQIAQIVRKKHYDKERRKMKEFLRQKWN